MICESIMLIIMFVVRVYGWLWLRECIARRCGTRSHTARLHDSRPHFRIPNSLRAFQTPDHQSPERLCPTHISKTCTQQRITETKQKNVKHNQSTRGPYRFTIYVCIYISSDASLVCHALCANARTSKSAERTMLLMLYVQTYAINIM